VWTISTASQRFAGGRGDQRQVGTDGGEAGHLDFRARRKQLRAAMLATLAAIAACRRSPNLLVADAGADRGNGLPSRIFLVGNAHAARETSVCARRQADVLLKQGLLNALQLIIFALFLKTYAQ